MKQDVIDELFEEWYGGETEEAQAFIDVVERFSSDRSDVEVEELILNLYDFSRQHPWPDFWLERLAKYYAIPEDWSEEIGRASCRERVEMWEVGVCVIKKKIGK